MATTKKSTADQVKAAMAKVEAAKAAEAAKADTKKAAETKAAAKAPVKAAEKKAPAKTTATKAAEKKAPAKTAAKTTTKAAEKKAPVKKAAPAKKAPVKKTETVYIQCCGYEVTTADITAKVVAAVGKKTVKELNIYVKPEEGKVYYTADGEQGSVDL